MKQLEMLYEGKAKQVFRTDDPDKIIIHYKDAATAFNNIKKATIENKGVLNIQPCRFGLYFLAPSCNLVVICHIYD